VAQIRLSALTVQNVVTYPVIIRADNPDGKLFPGMTANVICEVAHLTDVLRVPNAALRFKLSGDKGDARAKTGSRVWVLREPRGLPEAVKVKAGITDGLFTELREAAGIKAGDLLVVGTNGVAGEVKETVNPFAPPRMPGMRRPR
jgi:HlyD family secretion protein